jgi:FkbM family methyltransferase
MRFLNKPEYLLRPQQVLSRIHFAFRSEDKPLSIELPWGVPIRVQPDDVIGRSICTYGVYDLVTTESIFRLLDAGETAVDIGANIGYMTGVMARRAGPQGKVICFEPCTGVFRELSANLGQWRGHRTLAPVVAQQIALSRAEGDADLHIPTSFEHNHGIASLEVVLHNGPAQNIERVRVARLDQILEPDLVVGVMKIDVEGHEFGVLEGAQSLLAEHRIRDIIFEEHGTYPTPVHRLLESYGYTLRRLSRRFSKPLLLPSNDPRRWNEYPVGVLSNYLATLDHERAEARFSKSGWRALSSRH